jgi:3-deoxy-D-arabino-heptulosonate 7-phosphate (DAHP) synthase
MMGATDCLQVGACNMQNFDLLKELGQVSPCS